MEKIFYKSKSERYFCEPSSGYSRIRHASCLLDRSIYVFGGQQHGSAHVPTAFRVDCDTLQMIQLPADSIPSMCDQKAFNLVDGYFIWGGQSSKPSQPSAPLNDLWKFSGQHADSYEQLGEIPSGRVDSCLISLDLRYALLYGGLNQENLLKDWYLFDCYDHSWKSCKLVGDVPRQALYQPSLCWVFNRGYLFGGQTASSSISFEFCNDFYEVKLETSFGVQLRFKRLTSEGAPTPRSSHGCVVYQQKYIIIVGGQGPSKKQPFTNELLDDVWVYNVETCRWTKLSISIEPRMGFTCHLYNQKIFVLCGASSLTQLSSDIQIINFGDTSTSKTLCRLCQASFSFEMQPKFQHLQEQPRATTIDLSVQFIGGLSMLIKSPLHAIGLLLDNSYNMGANEIKIDLVVKSDAIRYLQIQDNSKPFSYKQFQDAIYKFNARRSVEMRNKEKQDILIDAEYGLNLKLGALRLGGCLLFVSKNEEETHLAFLSTSAMYTPHSDSFFCFQYSIKRKRQPLLSKHAFNRQRIIQAVRHIISPEDFSKLQNDYQKLYKKVLIFQLKKNERYELQTTDSDITLQNDHQGDLTLSLRHYLSYFHLQPYIGRPVFIKNKIVKTVNYLENLKNLKFSELQHQSLQKRCKKLQIFRIPEDEQKTPTCQGLLLYHDNRLFSIFNFQMSGLDDRKHSLGLAGVLEIPHEVLLNIVKTQIQGKLQRQTLRQELRKLLIGPKRSRQNGVEEECDYRKKKLKTNGQKNGSES